MATAGLLRGHFVPSVLCLAQRLSRSNICLGFGKWTLKAREKGMNSCLLLEVGSQGWAKLPRPMQGREGVTGEGRRQGFPEHMVLGHFFPSIWDLQCWYSGHQCVANPIWSSGWGCYLVVIAITLGQPVPNMHCPTPTLGGTGLFLPCG